MRPYNTYRNPELSQPVSSVEYTLEDRTSKSNASFDILRLLSESISVDCGSFELSESTEYYQPSSVPSQVEFVAPSVKENRTPVESAPAAPVNREPAKAPVKSSVNAVADMDDDDYDCMNDPNYRVESEKNASSPSFEELMARTAEGLAKMREETDRVGSQLEAGSAEISLFGNKTSSTRPRGFAPRSAYPISGNGELREQNRVVEDSAASRSQIRKESVENAPKSEKSVDSQSESAKKGFLSSISWDKTRKLLFSREAIKLTFLSIAVCAVIVSAVIYKKTSSRNNGLAESEDVVMNQTASEIQDVPVQGNEIVDNNNGFNASDNGDYWGQTDNNWNDPDASNRQAMTDSFQDDYQSPTFDGNQYSQDDLNDFPNPEDAGRQLVSPHNSNNGNQCVAARASGRGYVSEKAGFEDTRVHSGTDLVGFVETIPAYNPGPQYAEVAPAIGAQYSPDEYESPVLEDDSVNGYSETGYNSNFMR